MKISLMVMSAGKAAGKALPINVAQFIIGRDPQCNLRPASAMISKRHCAVLVKNEQVFLRDFDSTNGTFVNDQQVKGEVPLKDGDVLKVGPLSFKVVIEGAVAAAPKKATTPPPRPKTADAADDDAAAALLSVEADEGATPAASTETSEEEPVPGGTTVMDIPAFKPADAPAEPETPPTPAPEPAKAEAKPPEKKAAPPKGKPALGAAQDAAKALLEKMRSGKRPAAK